ncbi:MAG TPA: P-loop NTPase [Gemmatimonadaceae bacterium]|nr:P-loop NTPase [Gemmatimonadaceae bacterium]
MTQRKAIILAGAAGPEAEANTVLQRFGFERAVVAANLGELLAGVRAEHFDLVIVPLESMGPVELATVEREIVRGGATMVIGTAPQADPTLILQAMRAGVQEFLVVPPNAQDFSAAVDRLLRRGRMEVEKGTTIAVYSAKGGLGTTSISLNLAFALADANPNARVALADLVVHGGDLRVMLNLAPAYDVGDLAARVNRIDADLLTSILTPSAGGVWVLPSSDRPEIADMVDSAMAARLIVELRKHFVYTVLDCEHYLTDRTLAALDAADRIILVTQLNVAALRGTQRTIALCQRLGYGDEKLLIVVNRHQANEILTPSDARTLLNMPLYHLLPNDFRTADGAVSKGVPVARYDKSSRLTESYAALAMKLTGAKSANGKAATTGSRLSRIFSIGRK